MSNVPTRPMIVSNVIDLEICRSRKGLPPSRVAPMRPATPAPKPTKASRRTPRNPVANPTAGPGYPDMREKLFERIAPGSWPACPRRADPKQPND